MLRCGSLGLIPGDLYSSPQLHLPAEAPPPSLSHDCVDDSSAGMQDFVRPRPSYTAKTPTTWMKHICHFTPTFDIQFPGSLRFHPEPLVQHSTAKHCISPFLQRHSGNWTTSSAITPLLLNVCSIRTSSWDYFRQHTGPLLLSDNPTLDTASQSLWL